MDNNIIINVINRIPTAEYIVWVGVVVIVRSIIDISYLRLFQHKQVRFVTVQK